MLQNARVTTFTVSELLGENQRGDGGKITERLLLIFTVFLNYFFLSLFFLFFMSESCNYCEKKQGYQKALNNPPCGGFKKY